MATEKLGRYMEVEKLERPAGRKTDRWSIINPRDWEALGMVCWSGAGRQYIFVPGHMISFSADCLRHIARFVRRQNEAYKPPQEETHETSNAGSKDRTTDAAE